MGPLKRWWGLLWVATLVLGAIPLPPHALIGNLQTAVCLTLLELAVVGTVAAAAADV